MTLSPSAVAGAAMADWLVIWTFFRHSCFVIRHFRFAAPIVSISPKTAMNYFMSKTGAFIQPRRQGRSFGLFRPTV